MGQPMSRYPNYYAVLQVDMHASLPAIKRAWKHLLQKMRKHPDLGGNEHEAALINEAYTVLKDPLRRTAYDRLYVTHVLDQEQTLAGNGRAKAAQNRRRVKRINYVNEVYLQKPNTDISWPAQTQDISLYGLRLRTTQKVKPNDTIEVSFAQDPGFVIQGTVQWNRLIPQRFGNPIYEAGLEFKGMHMERFVKFLERSGLASQVSE
jgi:curved DNA-binding protein CbpA